MILPPESTLIKSSSSDLCAVSKLFTRTNIRTSISAGRYKEQMEQVDERPYWMWVQVDRPNKKTISC